MTGNHFYEFGPYRLDVLTQRLLRGDQPIALTPKAFDTLLLLVRNHQRTLEKRELMQELWPDTSVEEANLTQQIFTLRKLLGEQANGRPYIETIPKRGYHFAAPVKEVADEPQATAAIGENSAAQARAERSHRSLGRLLLGFALITVVVGLWAWARPQLTATNRSGSTLAVLPFKSFGGSDDDYLGLGLADALITKLGNLRHVTVRPTSAVRRYVAAGDPAEAGRELRADLVLDGSVQRSGDQFRLTVQLIDVSKGTPVWTEQFDTRWSDVFAVEDSISEQVTRALVAKFSSEEQRLVSKNYTKNVEAHRAYLRGRYFWNKRNEEGLRRATELLERAIEIDPAYALAYAGVADCYAVISFYTGASPRETLPKAKAAALRALEIDGGLAEAHTSLAYVKLLLDWDWQGAEREFKRAIDLNPNYATAHQWYSEYLRTRGRQDEALAEGNRALDIDPLSMIINMELALPFHYARRYDDAIRQFEKTLEMDRTFAPAHAHLGKALVEKGLYREAIRHFRKAQEVDNSPWILAAMGHAHARFGSRAEAQAMLRDLHERSTRTYVPPFTFALVHVGLGEKEQALLWLERGVEGGDWGLTGLKVEPWWDPLRGEERFVALLRQVGLE